jgi:putative redox protein
LEEQIRFKNQQGEQLAGTLHLPENQGNRGVVLGHCFTCTRHTAILRKLAQDLAGQGFVALRFDFSGNGQSDGEFADSTYTKQISEMLRAVEIVASQGAEWIGLAGHSMGALISFLTAARSDSVKAVAVIGGRLSGMRALHFLSREQRDILARTGAVTFTSRGRFLKLTDRFFSDADSFDPVNILRSFRIPLLVVHGDQDEIIPVQEAFKARELADERLQLEIIRGADHMFGRAEDRKTVSRLVVDWFKKLSN